LNITSVIGTAKTASGRFSGLRHIKQPLQLGNSPETHW